MVLRVVAYTTNSWVSPLARLRLIGPFDHAGIKLIRGTELDRTWPERVDQADIVVIQRDFPRHEQANHEIINLAKSAGKPVVYELDDLIFDLPEHHPDRLEGIYADALLPMLETVMQADAVTVSTKILAEFLRPFNSRIFILPNNLDETIWTMRSPKPKHKGPLVIGYMGGPSHSPDIHMVLPVLNRLAQRFKEKIAFRFLGIEPPPSLAEITQVSWERRLTMDYADFAAEFVTETIDIAIAPLNDNDFNRAKSGIKFLEYSALGVPGVYSALPPYADLITHQSDGLLASSLSDWEEYLTDLIENSELRLKLAKTAQQNITTHHLLGQNAGRWRKVYKQLAELPLKKQHDLLPAFQKTMAQVQMQLHALKRQSNTEELYIANREIRRLTSERDSFSHQLWKIQHDPLWLKVQSIRNWKNRIIKNVFTRSESSLSSDESKRIPRKLGDGVKLGEHNTLSEPHPGKFDIFLFSVMDWDTRMQRPQQLARQFACAGYRVFYLRTKFHSGEQAIVIPLEENIWEVYLPASRTVTIYHERLDSVLLNELSVAISQVIDAFRVKSAITLVNLPFWWPIVNLLRATENWPIVYDCMDYHRGFSSNDPIMLADEERLTIGSDLVLVTSHLLQQQIEVLNPNNLLLPNAADFDHFNEVSSSDIEEINDKEKPVIGYFGAIADWFDTELIRELALARSDWQFVLIGSTLYADLKPLTGLSNIVLLGEKPYSQLPHYLNNFDIAIIPFKKTPLTEATNPVKLFEYLSAGKPVVATNLDELRYFSDYVRLADTRDDWLEAIENALEEDKPEQISIRKEFASKNTWLARYKDAELRIQELFPLVSVIVLTYNNLDYTRQCLQSILDNTIYPNFEVIVVDNASSDNTPAYLSEMAQREPRINVKINNENVGFAAGNNQGANLASGEILIFLNNDTVVSKGWMSGLVKHVQGPDIGLVGPVTNSSGNETCIDVSYQTINEMDHFAEMYTAAHRGQIFDISMLAFLCVAIRRSVYDEIGPLDEQFGMGMFEDDDYARRLKAKGYRIIYAEDVFVHHWGSASFSKLQDKAYRKIFESNRRKLEAKWGIKWSPHRYRHE